MTQRGLAQARSQGGSLAALELAGQGLDCFASPQGRAWKTAEIALRCIGRVPVPDARLQEIGFGAWEGLTRDEIDLRWPEAMTLPDGFDWHFEAPGGEEFDTICARAKAFLDELTRPAVIVTHGVTSRVLRGLWLGLGREGMGALPGGQGVIYHLRGGGQELIRDGARDGRSG